MWTRGQVNEISFTCVEEEKLHVGILGISQINYIQGKINISNKFISRFFCNLSNGEFFVF